MRKGLSTIFLYPQGKLVVRITDISFQLSTMFRYTWRSNYVVSTVFAVRYNSRGAFDHCNDRRGPLLKRGPAKLRTVVLFVLRSFAQRLTFLVVV